MADWRRTEHAFVWVHDGEVEWEEVEAAVQRGLVHIREVTPTTDVDNVCFSKKPLTQEQVDYLHAEHLEWLRS